MTDQNVQPRDQLVAIMNRIYFGGMTTLSGGNLSILDEDGCIWITPAGIDKGRLTVPDMCCVRPDGEVSGQHRPSSELPFHRAIYAARPDCRAIVHAHPPALVSFSIARTAPDTSALPQISRICGPIGYAPYALTGSKNLGDVIAATFAAGHDVVLLENHGAVAAGTSLFDAFQKFEALDFCARTLIHAQRIGSVLSPLEGVPVLPVIPRGQAGEAYPADAGSLEVIYRAHLVDIVQRAYDRQLMLSMTGDASVRLEDSGFLITPAGMDRRHLTAEDMVFIRDGVAVAGEQPGLSASLHQAIYGQWPDVRAIILAQPPAATAFAVTDSNFDTRTIPESFIMLRDIPKAPIQAGERAVAQIAATVSPRSPVILIKHEGVLVTGKDLLQALDRLEVAEYSARSLIDSATIGPLQPMGEAELSELRAAFSL